MEKDKESKYVSHRRRKARDLSVLSRDGAAGLPQAHLSNNSNNKNPDHALFQRNSPITASAQCT